MVDVLLVILIFFMTITTAQVLKVDKTIKLPPAPHAQKKDNQRAEAIINVRWLEKTDGAEFVFQEKVYPKASDLVPLIRAAKEIGERKITRGDNPNFRIVIRGDRNVPAQYVAAAMNACAEAGIVDVSFSAVNKE